MKISRRVLARFVRLPDSDTDLRNLLDDLGLEVKRAHGGGNFTLELLANRGDHHCYDGIATEVSGRTGERRCGPEVYRLQSGAHPWEVNISSEKCLVYTTTLLRRASDNATLAVADYAVLEDAGIQSTLPPIDATNVANIELGQPTHAFDADTIEGPITVRESIVGECAYPLFADEPVEVLEGTLVIADDVKILAIAGVIGCEESKTTETTTRILLESACFDPVAVRKASRALNIHTDSSARFERGSDPSRPLIGAGRVVQMLLDTDAWELHGPSGVHENWDSTPLEIHLNADDTSSFLGIPLSVSDITQRLERYGFAKGAVKGSDVSFVVPPVRRWDVETRADLYEELAKSIGYSETPCILPPVGRGSQPSATEGRRRAIDEAMVALGFYEVITDGFYGRALVSKYGLSDSHDLMQHVETTNAMERAYGLLRTSGIGQALEAVAANHRWKVRDIKMYEHGRAFHPVALPDDTPSRSAMPCTERGMLWAICSGDERPDVWGETSRPADAHFMKGVLEQLASSLTMPVGFGPPDADHRLFELLHPNRQLSVELGGVSVGIMGEVHPEVVSRFKIKRARPCYLEIDTDRLAEATCRSGYSPPPAWHPIERSLAFGLPGQVSAGFIRAQLVAQSPPSVSQVHIGDVYEHEQDGEPVRAVTYNLIFDNPPEKSLSAEDVNQMVEALAENIVAGFGHVGVTQR
jgi:phenylalanyl-tRNA synthetase beta chain